MLFNIFINHLNDGEEFTSTSVLRKQNLEGLICQGVVLLSSRALTGWRNGLKGTLKSTPRQMPSPVLRDRKYLLMKFHIFQGDLTVFLVLNVDFNKLDLK